MADLYEASVVREKDGKSYWTRLGTMFPSKTGEGFTLVLNALPLAGTDGQARIILTVPKPKEDKPQGGYSGGGRRSDPDDERIPFTAEYR